MAPIRDSTLQWARNIFKTSQTGETKDELEVKSVKLSWKDQPPVATSWCGFKSFEPRSLREINLVRSEFEIMQTKWVCKKLKFSLDPLTLWIHATHFLSYFVLVNCTKLLVASGTISYILFSCNFVQIPIIWSYRI